MRLTSLPQDEVTVLGEEMHGYVQDLFPLCRSITGSGVRATLRQVNDVLPVDVTEVPSGSKVLDWEVPPEWNIDDAYIADMDGNRVVDFRTCNLHVVGYSTPVDKVIDRAELDQHLHSLPDQPDLIPFRTSFYTQDWGFCLTEKQRQALSEPRYRVVIDSSLQPGSLTYGEVRIAGRTDDEVLLTTHICHPSLANDNLSGIVVLMTLGRILQGAALRYSYRLLFNPVTIGSITWLARNRSSVGRIRHGLVLAGLGDAGPLTYKRSRRGAAIDTVAEHVLDHGAAPSAIEDFSPYGYDERQFCSPGFDLPIGALSRTPHGRYPEYHTSADNPGFVSAPQLGGALNTVLEMLAVLEGDDRLQNLAPYGEPQLGRRGLYKAIGGQADASTMQMAILWILNLSDGSHSLLDIAARAGLPFAVVRRAADELAAAGLLATHDDGGAA